MTNARHESSFEWTRLTEARAGEFLPDIVRSQEHPPSPLPRAVLGALLGLLGVMLLWACFGRLDIVAVAQGKLVPQTFLKIVQPAESGIVRELVIMACDAQASTVGRFQRGDRIELGALPGGGGTDFRPPFILAEQEGISPTCAAYLTDMYGHFPDCPPPYPVLWVSTSANPSAPFGTCIEMGAV